MNVHLSDDEQVEALKKWWNENGKSIIAGAVLGLALIGGWNLWQQYQRQQGELASAYFESFYKSPADDVDMSVRQGERLIKEQGGSVYAIFAALELAKREYQAGNLDAAYSRLVWAEQEAADDSLKQLAGLRIARLLVDKGDLSAAKTKLNGIIAAAYAGETAVLKGDIALLEKDNAAAAAAYQDALNMDVANPALVRMKLAETGINEG